MYSQLIPKTSSTVIYKVQYGDDSTATSLNPVDLQRTFKSSFEAYTRTSLEVNTPKTIIMQTLFCYVDTPCVTTASNTSEELTVILLPG